MLDHFLALRKELFLEAGGFSKGAGEYRLPDLCLKITQVTGDKDAAIYLPDLKLIFLDTPPKRTSGDDSVYFYGRWHGRLWESEKQLYENDGFSPQDLEQAKVTAAMRSSG